MKTNFPKTWQVKKLGEICQINPSRIEISELPENLEVSFVPMSAVSEETGTITSSEIRKLKDVRKGYTYFKEGDVLFAKITPCMENGKSAIAKNLINGIGFGSTEFHVLRPTEAILAEWVHSFIRQKSFREEVAKHFTGTAGQQRIPIEFLKTETIPLPPLSIQESIVERFDTIKKAQELNERQIKLADELFQSLLHKELDVRGKDWEMKKLGELLKIVQYGLSIKMNTEKKGYKIFRMNNIVDGKLTENDIKYAEVSTKEFKKYTLEIGDVLINRVNSYELVGKVGIFKLSGDYTFASYLIRLRGKDLLINQDFMNYFLNSNYGQRQIKRKARQAVSQANINSNEIKQIKIPLPPLPVQEQIVEKLQAVQDYKKKLLEQKRKLRELFESCLAKAMKGELVSPKEIS